MYGITSYFRLEKRIMKIRVLIYLISAIFSIFPFVVYAEDCQGEPCKEASLSNPSSIKDLSYEDFFQLKNSGTPFTLWDVRGEENYKKNHIPGAESFPLRLMNEKSIAERTTKEKLIVVYCSSKTCPMSGNAAEILTESGYNVMHYKGGLVEWIEKGNLAEHE